MLKLNDKNEMIKGKNIEYILVCKTIEPHTNKNT